MALVAGQVGENVRRSRKSQVRDPTPLTRANADPPCVVSAARLPTGKEGLRILVGWALLKGGSRDPQVGGLSAPSSLRVTGKWLASQPRAEESQGRSARGHSVFILL